MRGTLAERHAAKVDRRGPDECWPWTAGRNSDGYGVIRDETGRCVLAHRVAYVAAGGDPAVAVVRHVCDDPGCVNPSHLLPGTQAENLADMVERGRHATGERNGSAKLTRAAVRRIRASARRGVPIGALAAEHGVSHSTVSYAVSGRTWA